MGQLAEIKAINSLKILAMAAGGFHTNVAKIVLACMEYDKKYDAESMPKHLPESDFQTLGKTMRREGKFISIADEVKALNGETVFTRHSVLIFQGVIYKMLMTNGRTIRIVEA
jgi:hypothetical protein